jgi:hypothetical protein
MMPSRELECNPHLAEPWHCHECNAPELMTTAEIFYGRETDRVPHRWNITKSGFCKDCWRCRVCCNCEPGE